jgi:hypothetical protein
MDRRRRVKRIMKIIHLRVKKGIYRTVSKPALTPLTDHLGKNREVQAQRAESLAE